MYTLAVKGVEIGCAARHKGLAFTCSHLGDAPLVKDDGADYLHGIGLFAQHSPRSLTHCCQCLGEYIIKSLAVCKSLLEFGCLCLELLFREGCVFLIERQHLILDRLYLFKLSL